MGYTKLFSEILDSSIWLEPAETRLVWITMMAMSDANGEVMASVPGLAKRAGVPLPKCEEALACLLSADPYSRSSEYDGRRISVIDGGWELLNHERYRFKNSPQDRRERDRKRKKRSRNSASASVRNVADGIGQSVTCHTLSRQSDTDSTTSAATPTVLENDIPPISTNDSLFLKDSFPNQSKRAQGKNHFDDFWAVVHKKIQKRNAQTAFKKAVDRVASERGIPKADAAAMITAAMTEYAASPSGDPQGRSPTHPATWLNSGQYDDDPETWVENQQLTPGQRRVAATQQAIEGFING